MMNKNTLAVHLPFDIDEQQCPEKSDVISLHRQQRWEELDNVVICINSRGEINARFGESVWNVEPLLMTKNSTHKHVNFSELNNHTELLYEIKLICYGWLFTKNLQYSAPTKVSTIIGRISGLKMSYRFLAENEFNSLARLNEPEIWGKFLAFLELQGKSAGTLVHIFCALQQAQMLFPWMGLNYPEMKFSPTHISKKVCRPEATEREQTLAIPQEIADKLLQHAVNLVEIAWPHRDSLGETERRLQENYQLGEKEVRNKILSGRWKWLAQEDEKATFKHDFAKEANYLAPYKASDIIAEHLLNYPEYKTGANGIWWNSHRANLTAACFTCCAAFSGMRESELFELTQDSYYNSVYNGRTFHFLKAKTHKMAEKHTEWVVAPVVEKVIQLMSALTAHLRDFLLQNAKTKREVELAKCLWVSQGQRSTLPKRISCWSIKLTNYSKYVGAIVSEKDRAECLYSNPHSSERVRKFVHVGKHWALSPHQFRRTLAFFTIKNRLGNAIAIKQQFKHLYLQMSEWYCEGGIPSRLQDVEADQELQKMIDTIGNEQITHKYWSWLHGKDTLSGSHGKDILGLRDELPLIYSSWESLYKLVKEKRLTLHGTLHSYCKNGYDCDMGGVINPAFCVDCGSHGSIIDGEQAIWWKNKHDVMISYLAENPSSSAAIYTHCLTQIRAAEKVMADFSIDYTAYQPEIEIKSDE